MLTDADCRNAKCPQGKNRHRLTDARGLYLEVSPTGSRRWFWRFFPAGKEDRLALGRLQLEEDVTGKQRLEEDHLLAAVFPDAPITGQRGGKTLALAVLH